MKKAFFLILAAAVVLLSCEKNSADRKQSGTASASAPATVTDSRGSTITIPAEVKSIATFPAPHPHIIVYLDGNASRIRGIHPLAAKAAEASLLSHIAPDLLEKEDNFLSGSLLNAEELLRIDPDVFFTDQLLQGIEKIEEAGIPVIYLGLEKESIPYRGGEAEVFSPEKSMGEWVRITAAVLGSSKKKADAILGEWRDVSREIAEKTSSIPDSEKKKILIVFRTAGNLVAGGGSFGHYWIASTGGINAAEGVSGNHPAMVKIAGFEEILGWNPDIIYLTNFEETMPEDIYENRIPGQDWSGTNAFKNRQVYKIPLGTYRWYPPSLDGPLMLKWMAGINYPSLFSWDMEREISDYYERHYSYKLTDEEISSILNPSGSGNF